LNYYSVPGLGGGKLAFVGKTIYMHTTT